MPDFINAKIKESRFSRKPEHKEIPEYTKPGAEDFGPQEREKQVEQEIPAQESALEQPGASPSQHSPHADRIVTLKERVATPHTKSERLQEIERIMSDGLADIYANLNQQAQQEIKQEGEKAANQIERIIEQGQTVAKKILEILRDWLKKIPGVNKFFLEQESKLKTDKIMAITRKK